MCSSRKSPRKKGPAVKYAQIVESLRIPGHSTPKHQVVLSLGRADQIDRVRLSKLISLLQDYLQDEKSRPLPQQVSIGQSREYGVGWVIEALWKRLGLDLFFKLELKRRKIEIPVERAMLAMTAHRAQEPTSKLKDFYWLRNEAFFPWGAKVELHHLYRSLDFLQENREALEDGLYQHRRDLFNRAVELIYFDTTTVHFEIEDDPEEPRPWRGLRQYGRPKDGRISHRQIVVGMAVDPDGLPLLSQTFPGNTVDVKTVAPVVARLKEMKVEEIVFVSDRGTVSQENLKAIRQAGLHYIVGLKLRQAKDLRPIIVRDASPYQMVQENLLAKKVMLEGRPLVVCYSPQSAERDVKMRGRALERLNEKLAKVKTARDHQKAEAEILKHQLFRRWVERDDKGALVVSREKVAAESACDGTFVLETSNPQLSPAQVALGYKGLMRVEHAWQSFKHSLDIQPVFLRKDERIEAHVTLCMITYLLERWAEIQSGLTFDRIRHLLRPLHAVELIQEDQHLWKPSSLDKEQKNLLKKLSLPQPPPVLHLGALPQMELQDHTFQM
jgi:hypothetical protein